MASGHRGRNGYVALALFLVLFGLLVIGGSVFLYFDFGDVDVGASWGAVAFTAGAAGVLIAFFLWLGRRAGR